MASNFMTFKTLLGKRVQEGGKIPSFVLKNNSDLGQAFDRVVTSEKVLENETPGQTTERYIDEICESLGKEENSKVVSSFNDAVAAFTSKMKNAWDAVTAIKETGNELAAQMEKVVADQLSTNEFVSKHLNYSNLKADFPVFTWDGTKVMGSMQEIIKKVNALMTNEGEPSEELNMSLFNIIISDMSKYGSVTPLENYSEDARKAAIDALMQICQNIPAETVAIAVDAMTGVDTNCPVHKALGEIRNLAFAQSHLFENVKLFDNAITSFFPIYDLIITGQVVPIPSAKETIVENAKSLVKVLEIAAYYEYAQRTGVLREAFLLQGGMVNADTEEEFKKAGGTTKMIGEFIRYMYNDDMDKIPVTGIKSEPIVSSAASVSEKVSKDIANVSSRITLAKNMARTSAYRIVMRDYISKTIKREDENIDGGQLSTQIEQKMKAIIMPIVEDIRQYGVNFIDAAMNGIVGVQHPGSFVEHLFKELGAAYISATDNTDTVTAADLRQVDVRVMSKLIATFLADTLVEYVPEGTTGPLATA